MEFLCDNILEEILVRLPDKQHLRRVRAVARRYNAITRRPAFAARHRQMHSPFLSGGVFLNTTTRSSSYLRGSFTCFLPASSSSTAAPSAAAAFPFDLASILPSPTPTELAYLFRIGDADPDAASRSFFIVHSSAGLLLCCRGYERQVHYYVCDPVARRCVALSELPRPPAGKNSGLLSVSTDVGAVVKSFQVVLFDQNMAWWHCRTHASVGCLDLEVFSSDSGAWVAVRVPRTPELAGCNFFAPPCLGLDGTAYWIGFEPRDVAVVYSCVGHSDRVIPVPSRARDISVVNRCLGERLRRGGAGGGAVLRYAHFDMAEFEVWDLAPRPGTAECTLVHRAALKDVARCVNGWYTLGWVPVSSDAMWCSVFSLVGFDPADDDVFFFLQDSTGRLASYSLRPRKLSFRCQIDPDKAASLASFEMFPYVRPPLPVQLPGMQCLDEE